MYVSSLYYAIAQIEIRKEWIVHIWATRTKIPPILTGAGPILDPLPPLSACVQNPRPPSPWTRPHSRKILVSDTKSNVESFWHRFVDCFWLIIVGTSCYQVALDHQIDILLSYWRQFVEFGRYFLVSGRNKVVNADVRKWPLLADPPPPLLRTSFMDGPLHSLLLRAEVETISF